MNFLHARAGMELAIKNAVTMTEEIHGVLFQIFISLAMGKIDWLDSRGRCP